MNAVNRGLAYFASKSVLPGGPGFLREVINASGVIAQLKVGETIAAGDMLYFKESDKEFLKADADAAASMPIVAMALEAGVNGGYAKSLLYGYVRADFLGLLNRAVGTITISGDVGDNDSFTIGGQKYEFTVDGTTTGTGTVAIDASESVAKADMQDALVAAFTAATKAKFAYGDWASDVLTLYAQYPLYRGTEGNALTLVKSGTNLAVSGATLAGNDGGLVYAGLTTGAVQFSAPSAAPDVVQIVGMGISADEMIFNPSLSTTVVQ